MLGSPHASLKTCTTAAAVAAVRDAAKLVPDRAVAQLQLHSAVQAGGGWVHPQLGAVLDRETGSPMPRNTLG